MEDCKNEAERRPKDRSPSPAIKSTAVVKYTAFQSPVSYARLQCNTDLNLPPSNWGAAVDSYGLKQILTRGSGLSSFRMAHMFPDSVGEVDVISGAECIKKLLKLPYQPNATISMMVHRVENTLLLDDFDVYDYLMKSEWSWLKDFFYENILKTMSEQERMKLMLAPAPSSALQLTHKFLSHSVAAPAPKRRDTPARPICISGPFLPEPEIPNEECPNDHLYNRNVLWTFEDIHMLIGSDLPIFGDKDRPCVSLRLRDARDPINVLTGIDYWLDNLMCNVPEVLMCYHLDGIVQKYEPMKTEDLPNMENSKFSPKVIRNVAQNILSFLKSNATKAGHTYWLFKGPHDDVVKLYDLTSLCPDSLDNPFTTPVAMLLYRVARNMTLMNKTKHVRQLLEHVIKLLKMERYPQIVASSHIMLANLYVPANTNPARPDFKDESSDSDGEDDVEFPHEHETDPSEHRDHASSKDDSTCQNDSNDKDESIDNAACFSAEDRDTYKNVAFSTNDKQKIVCDKEEKSAVGNDVACDNHSTNELAVQITGLALRNIGDRVGGAGRDSKRKSRARGLGVAAAERCSRALQHCLKGLLALHHITIGKCREEERERLRQQIIVEEQHPKMANPYEPIKMNYEPISKSNKDPKEHISRSRRRKLRKNLDKSGNSLIEAAQNIDKNAILIRRDNNRTCYEPSRDDNFAWKLHLKTLLYEKICLAYTTLAEHTYTLDQYGLSLKYIDMASKCQKLLSNMIIRSCMVDAICLFGRVGDNYFQLSKFFHDIEEYRKQFEVDHDLDSQLRVEIENDIAEEVDGDAGGDFDLDLTLPTSDVHAMLLSMTYYGRAGGGGPHSAGGGPHSAGGGPHSAGGGPHSAGKRPELRRRLASVSNELAVRYMNDAEQLYAKYLEEPDQKGPNAKLLFKQFANLSRCTLECLDEATKTFQHVDDVTNLALISCNKARYMRFKAHCSQGDFNSEKLSLYNQAEDLYLSVLKRLGPRETCETAYIWDLVSWELSCHVYTRAVVMQDCPGVFTNEVSEVAEAFKHALKYCLLSPGPKQYLYQFRAAMIHHRLASLYHSQYRITTEEGPKRRTLLNATRTNYENAANLFASLEDAGMYLTVQLEYVAMLETQAALSPNLKLKSLQTAIQVLRQCHSIMKLIQEREPDEQKEAPSPDGDEGKSVYKEHQLLTLYESRLHFILKSIIQYCRLKSNKDYERINDMYKKLYSASLRIRKDDDAKLYAGSICNVLLAMDAISKEFE